MIKQTLVVNTTGRIVNDLFREMIINNRTIHYLRKELESGLKSPEKILKTYYLFIEALHLKDEIIGLLENMCPEQTWPNNLKTTKALVN